MCKRATLRQQRVYEGCQLVFYNFSGLWTLDQEVKSRDEEKQCVWFICNTLVGKYQSICLLRHHVTGGKWAGDECRMASANTWLTTGLWPVFVVTNRHHQWLMSGGSPHATPDLLLVLYCLSSWVSLKSWTCSVKMIPCWRWSEREMDTISSARDCAGGNDERMNGETFPRPGHSHRH